jgi:hypothetical protein
MAVDDSGGTEQDIRSDITNFNFAVPRGVQDTTGIDKFAMERLLLLADLSFTWNGVFNDESGKSHAVFSTVSLSPGVAREFTLTVSNQQLGKTPQAAVLPTDYAITRNADGSLTWSVPAVLANGVIPTWTTV